MKIRPTKSALARENAELVNTIAELRKRCELLYTHEYNVMA